MPIAIRNHRPRAGATADNHRGAGNRHPMNVCDVAADRGLVRRRSDLGNDQLDVGFAGCWRQGQVPDNYVVLCTRDKVFRDLGLKPSSAAHRVIVIAGECRRHEASTISTGGVDCDHGIENCCRGRRIARSDNVLSTDRRSPRVPNASQ